MKENYVDYRHIYLYAKGWYQRSSNIFTDIKKILANRSGVNYQHIGNDIVLDALLRLAYKHIKNERNFLDFWEKISPDGIYRKNALLGQPTQEDNGFYEATLRACLSILRYVDVKEIDGSLGKANYSILPKPKHIVANKISDEYAFWCNQLP